MQMAKFKKTSQGRAGRPKGSKDDAKDRLSILLQKPRCKRQTSRLVQDRDIASNCEESTGRSLKIMELDKSNVMFYSTSNDLDSVNASNVCSGYDNVSYSKVSEVFEDENEMIYHGLEMGRLVPLIGLWDISFESTSEMPACWELPE